jgi:2-phospho-L-lactate guanylyltransferase
MAMDSVAAALACAAVTGVLVVTDDPVAAAAARDLGATVVPDHPGAGLDAALAYGAGQARVQRPGCPVATLAADVPATRPEELSQALVAASSVDRAVVADSAGDGTVLLTARAGLDLEPAFGAGSLRRHVAAGAVALDLATPGLRRDVDTLADLAAALVLGAGVRTTVVAARIDLAPADLAVEVHGTVREHAVDSGAGTVVLDDGTSLAYDDQALQTGGLRLLRPGQRVRIETAGNGADRRVLRLTIATLDWPDAGPV